MPVFRKIYLKTKVSGEVVETDLKKRESAFDDETKSWYVKDYQGVMHKFSSIDDGVISAHRTWSSDKILSELNEYSLPNRWLEGTTVPPSTLGSEGNHYINTITKDVYKKKTIPIGGVDSFTTLMIHSDSVDGNQEFEDSSQSDHDITFFGSVEHSNDQKVFGDTSIKFNGDQAISGLKIEHSDDFSFDEYEFSIDFRIRFEQLNNTQVLFSRKKENVSDFWKLEYDNVNHHLEFTHDTVDTGSIGIVGSIIFEVDTWYHIAIVGEIDEISGDRVFRLIVDGVLISSSIYDTFDYFYGPLYIGSYDENTSDSFVGWMDEIRISSGIARDFIDDVPTEVYTVPDGSTTLDSWWLLGNIRDNNRFTSLVDLPNDYTNQSGKILIVNETEDGLRFESFNPNGVYEFVDLTDTPSTYAGQANRLVAVAGDESGLEFVDRSSSGIKFIELSDVPTSYAQSRYKVPRVNYNQNGLEFVDDIRNLIDLSDVNASNYTGDRHKILRVNSSESGVEFAEPTVMQQLLIIDSRADLPATADVGTLVVASGPTGDGNMYVFIGWYTRDGYQTPTYENKWLVKSGNRYEATSVFPSTSTYIIPIGTRLFSEDDGTWFIYTGSEWIDTKEDLAPATATNLGGIKVGDRLTVEQDGTLNADLQSSYNFDYNYKYKLDNIQANANNYVHPSTHPAVIIEEDTTHRFVTDAQILAWNAASGEFVPATETTLGVIKVGDRLSVEVDGTLNADLQSDENFTTALKNKLEGMAPSGLSPATIADLGGIIVGERLSVEVDGTLSANVQSDNNFTDALKNKLDGVDDSANYYVHPSTHSASMITTSTSRRFVTDAQIALWTAGGSVEWDNITSKPSVFPPDTHYHDFVDLTDSPANYTGQAGKILQVNSGEDGLEFIDNPGSVDDGDWSSADSPPGNWSDTHNHGVTFDAVVSTTSVNSTFRYVIPSSELSTSGTSIRLKFQSIEGYTLYVYKCYVGHASQTVGADTFDFDGNQVQMSVNEETSFYITNGETVTTDIETFTLDPTRNLIVAMYVADFGHLSKSSLTGNCSYYFKNGDYSYQTDVASGGWVQSSNIYAFISEIEVKTSDTGSDGDYYLDTGTGDIYKKITGVWTKQGNIRGPRGLKGDDGDAGSTTFIGLTDVPSSYSTYANKRVTVNATADGLVFSDKYEHPSTHPATIITQDTTHRFITDAERIAWNAAASGSIPPATTSTIGGIIVGDRLTVAIDGTLDADVQTDNNFTDALKSKLDGIASGANNYTHPVTHPPSIIAEDSNNRFVTDAQIAQWNSGSATNFTDLSDTPANYSGHSQKLVRVNAGETALEFVDSTAGGGSGVDEFIELTDTPGSFTANKYLKVNAGATALEFVDEPSGVDTFLGLTDSPGSFSGHGLKVVRVNSGANALEFNTPTFLDLNDTPGSFIANRYVKVNSAGNALEFTDSTAGGSDVDEFLELIDAPSSYSGQSLKLIRVNAGETGVEFTDPYTHPATHPPSIIAEDTNDRFVSDSQISTWDGKPDNFLELPDTPSSFSGQSGKNIRVKSTEDGLEFYDSTAGSGSGADTFIELTDTPVSFSGNEGYVVRVNESGTALEFFDSTTDFTGYDEFIELADTPSSFIGQGSKILYVADNELSVDFKDPTFIDLTDTPASYPEAAGTWARRIDITINSLLVDEDLTDFPIMLDLTNHTEIFSIISDSDKLKMSARVYDSTSDSETECYVEIDHYDSTSNTGILWVKVPNVSSTEDTVLRLYYDDTQLDNTTYVGVTESVAAQNVWDSNYIGVWHLNAEDPSVTDSVKDSTQNNNDGNTPTSNKPTLVDTDRLGKGYEFYSHYGSDAPRIACDCVGITNTKYTVEITAKPVVTAVNDGLWCISDGNSESARNDLRIYDGDMDNRVTTVTIMGYPMPDAGQWHTFGTTWDFDGNSFVSYLDGAIVDTSSSTRSAAGGLDTFSIGAWNYYGSWNTEATVISDVRLSNGVRSYAWMKASAYNSNDGLVSFAENVTLFNPQVVLANNSGVTFEEIDNFLNLYQLIDTPNSYTGQSGKVLSVKSTEDGIEFTTPTVTDEFLDLTDTPSTYSGSEGYNVRVNQSGTALEFYDSTSDGGSGVDEFIELIDTPSTFSGQSGKSIRVNQTENGLEFYDSTTDFTGYDEFVELIDTPSSYSGQAGKNIRVNQTETALEFYDSTADFSSYDEFVELTDTPSSFSGHGLKVVRVNIDEDALEFYDSTASDVDEFIELIDTPSSYSGNELKSIRVNQFGTALEFYDSTASGGSGVDEFIELIDTPSSYSGYERYNVRVNNDGTGLEFYDSTTDFTGYDEFLELTDTPSTYFGQSGKYLIVNPGETAITFTDSAGGDGGASDFLDLTDTPSEYPLSGNWSNRYTMTIDSSNIDADLIDFPIRIDLSNMTDVFSELSDADKLKMSVRHYDSTSSETECYTEIESYNSSAQTGVLWSKIPSISSSQDTTIYLYFDKTRSDNSTYIGVLGSTPAQTVWSNDFGAVYHMNQDPSQAGGDEIKDSTVNANHGSCIGGDVLTSVSTTYCDTGVQFVGGGNTSSIGAIQISSPLNVNKNVGTHQATMKTGSSWDTIICNYYSSTSSEYDRFYQGVNSSGDQFFVTDRLNNVDGNSLLTSNHWYNVACTFDFDNDNYEFFYSGVSNGAFTPNYNAPSTLLGYMIGSMLVGVGGWFRVGDATFAELKISNVVRSDAWIKATYLSDYDQLITYGTSESINTNIIIVSGDGLVFETKDDFMDFVDLRDTPNDYTGQAGKNIRVNSGETGLEFYDATSGGESGVDEFIELIDTPSSFIGQTGKHLVVNGSETALEFATVTDTGVTTFLELTDTPSGYPSSGYGRRVTITLSYTYIDDDLTDFPVMINLSTYTDIFSELSDDDKLKMSVCQYDSTNGEVECYTEIQSYNSSAQTGILWVKVPHVSSTENTIIRIYYDSTASNNTSYVGTTTSSAAQNVWDDDYIIVYHFEENPISGSDIIKDSTQYLNHGSPNVSLTHTEMSGTPDLDYAVQNASSGDRKIEMGTSNFDKGLFTLETITRIDDASSKYPGLLLLHTDDDNKLHFYEQGPNNKLRFTTAVGGSGETIFEYDRVDDDAWHFYGLKADFDNDEYSLWEDNTEVATSSSTHTELTALGTPYIGPSYFSSNWYSGNYIIGEYRVSKIARSDAWIKASYYSTYDSLLTFGGEEIVSTSIATVSGNSIIFTDKVNFIDFIELGDTPSVYTGQSGKNIRVKSSEDGLEFYDSTTDFAGYDEFIELTDTPSSYSGQAGKVATVNESETALEFLTSSSGGIQWYDDVGDIPYDLTSYYLNETTGDITKYESTAGWLGTWAKRIEITVDNTNIDSDLTHFPIPIVLGSSVGGSSQDITDIFDEVGSSWQKIAVTKSDGTTQLYVEKEVWDSGTENALLWVSKSDLTLSSSTTTTLYLYFDSSQGNNTTYVADPGNRTEVWDSNFVARYGMTEDPSIGNILDSTINSYDCVPNGSMTSGDLVDGPLGKSINFDGSNDYAKSSAQNLSSLESSFTVEAYIKWVSLNAAWDRICQIGGDSNGAILMARSNTTSYLTNSVWGDDVATTLGTDVGNYHYVFQTFNGTTAYMHRDLTEDPATNGVTVSSKSSASIIIAGGNSGTYNGNVEIDEFRVSNIERSDVWLKANYYALTDDLLSYGSVENNIVSVGTVKPSWLDLIDTPSVYTDQAGKSVRVNQSENGLEFYDSTSGGESGVDEFIELIDTPSSFIGQAGKYAVVNQAETALEFVDSTAGGDGSSVDEFIELIDTPSSFIGQGEKVVSVNVGETALEFTTINSGVSAFTELTDTPSSLPDSFSWAKRVELTISPTYIDSDLTNFPVTINLSDYTDIFSELSDTDKLKISVTYTDSTSSETECYVEVSEFDETNQRGFLYVKVPTVSSSENTTLYLYYDSNQSNNTTYVGITGSDAAKNVWDDDYVIVYHMEEEPNAGSDIIKDSTQYSNHGSPSHNQIQVDTADGTPDVGNSVKIDRSVSSASRITMGNSNFNKDTFTLEATCRLDNYPSRYPSLLTMTNNNNNNRMQLGLNDSNHIRLNNVLSGSNNAILDAARTDDDTWHHYAYKVDFNNDEYELFEDSVSVDSNTSSYSPQSSVTTLTMGAIYYSGYQNGHATVGEYRVSKIVRSDAWLKATYHTIYNNIITFGSEELSEIQLVTASSSGLTFTSSSSYISSEKIVTTPDDELTDNAGKIAIVNPGETAFSLTNDYVKATDLDMNGFENRTDSTLTWTDSTPDRTLSIQPTGTSFNYWVNGVKYTSTGDTKQITNTEGIWIFYYDSNGLQAINSPTSAQVDTAIRNYAIACVVYWNATDEEAIFVGEERHGIHMSPDTHAYLHFTEGARYLYGLGLVDIDADQDGSLDSHAQFGVDAGAISDEDIYHNISAIDSTAGIPIYYMLGSEARWVRYNKTGFAVRTYDGTNSTRLAYNQYTGGSWQLTEVGHTDYVLYHIFATTGKDNPIISIMGQNNYNNIHDARDGALSEIRNIELVELLFPEIKVLATVIFYTADSLGNSVNADIVTNEDGDDYVDWRNERVGRVEVTTSDHGSLSGLIDDDHTQYTLLDGRDGDILKIDEVRAYDGAGLKLNDDSGTSGIFIEDGGEVGFGTNSPTAAIDVDSDKIRVRTSKTPATSGAAGNAGDICWDTNYVYICVATNTWKRAAISTW